MERTPAGQNWGFSKNVASFSLGHPYAFLALNMFWGFPPQWANAAHRTKQFIIDTRASPFAVSYALVPLDVGVQIKFLEVAKFNCSKVLHQYLEPWITFV